MKTSYFANLKNITGTAVAICRHSPSWYTGHAYLDLAPSQHLLDVYRAGRISSTDFAVKYRRETLDHLDARMVVSDLNGYGPDIVLLCYEKPGSFCHRRVVRSWLQDSIGKVVKEYGHEYPTLFKL